MSRMRFPFGGREDGYGGRPRSSLKMRLIIAAVLVIFAFISYYGRPGDENQITGESQRVAFNDEADEVRMGLQALPEMAAQFGGEDPNPRDRAVVNQVGQQLLQALDTNLEAGGRHNPYREAFRFTLLGDARTVNAFALPGGQVFITRALYDQLATPGQLAGVLSHEIGHVIERHGNQRMADQQFWQGIAAAGGVAGGDMQSARLAQAVTQIAQMKYGREDELESDKWGVRLMYMAGYDPRAMIGVMEVLDRASQGQAPPEFLSTHPKPANRVKYIQEVIDKEFPEGLPADLRK
jgi:predicted Zn-dependent protease